MKLTHFFFGVALCSAASLVSCKKNDIASNDLPATIPGRVVNGVIPDDPKLLAKVPIIISADYLATKMQDLLARAKGAPVKGGGGGPKSGGDITAPSVSITSPVSGSSVDAGSTVYVTISASDNTGVSSETFSVDGVTQSSINGTVASFTWNTTGFASGTHTLTVTAKDVAGNAGSASIVVTINTTVITTPPTPASGYQLIMPPVITQGSEGSCVSFAVGYYTRSAEQYNNTSSPGYSYSSNIFSPEYLFDLTKSDSTSCSGSSVLNTYNFLQANGICTWQTVPYSSSNGCTLSPTASQTSEAANFKISSYSYVTTADLAAMKQMLNLKHPLVVSFMVDSYFYNAGPGFIWKSTSGIYYGRHAVAICGYDDTKHAYKVINSWGIGWGDYGYSWIDYDYLPVLCSYSYVMNF